VPVISVPQAFNEKELYVDLRSSFEHPLFLKCEGFNFAGSIKLKPVTERVEAADREGVLTPKSVLVESSSGKLGVALSMLAASKGYRFLCVTDSRCKLATRRLMVALGSQVHVIAEPDPIDSFLGARLDYVRALCASDGRYVWLNQYIDPGDWQAHHRTTAPAIARQFPRLDVLFVGAGTAGTLMGCARYLREWHRGVQVIAVDSVGSVAFGGPGSTDDSRTGHQRPSAVAPYVLRGRCGPRRGGGHGPCLPPAVQARIPVRRIHRHGRQRRDELAHPQWRGASLRWRSARTLASAISTPSTSPTGWRTSMARTCSTPLT
jgi:cysteine synthase